MPKIYLTEEQIELLQALLQQARESKDLDFDDGELSELQECFEDIDGIAPLDNFDDDTY